MSFEGFYQMLCSNGHLTEYDVYDDRGSCCRHEFCRKPYEMEHLVDTTNGIDEDFISTRRASVELIGQDDHWLTDRYGTFYSVSVPRYRHIGCGWVRVDGVEQPEQDNQTAETCKHHLQHTAALLSTCKQAVDLAISKARRDGLNGRRCTVADVLLMAPELRQQWGAIDDNPNNWADWLQQICR